MIKEVSAIPKKKQSKRDLLYADIKKAITDGISKFEFTGYGEYKYLAKYAYEAAEMVEYDTLRKMFLDYKEKNENAECKIGDFRLCIGHGKHGYVEITSWREKKEDAPRVFGEIHADKLQIIFDNELKAAQEYRKDCDARKAEREKRKNENQP